MTKEEQIALDAWRDDQAWVVLYRQGKAANEANHHEAYRELVVNDVRPPVVVDQALQLWQDIDCPKYEALKAIRTYGDERHAEGERAGIERAHHWCLKNDMFHGKSHLDRYFRRDLLGEEQQ